MQTSVVFVSGVIIRSTLYCTLPPQGGDVLHGLVQLFGTQQLVDEVVAA